ncbi:glycoside hydrolase family 76 protein [Moniliophthora roreri]|nr:glycoside hydrolase family 76 protein [Moniliophthora roreri]
MACHRKLLFWSLVAPSVLAQTFSPSSSWRKPYLSITPEERIQIAAAALDKAVSMLDSRGQFSDTIGGNYGLAGNMASQMAMFDRATNQTKYKDKLTELFPKAQEVNKGFLDQLSYAYAAAQAYSAYRDDTFLRFAETAWASGRAYTLSDADVAAGKIATKNFAIKKECSGGISLAGGTFWAVFEDHTALVGLATGSSALLAEATGNQTYLDAAIESANFFHAHLYNVNNVVMDSISASSNDSCPTNGAGGDSWSTGYLVEGLAILASITKNPETEQLLRQTIYATLNNPERQGSSGVIKFQYADMTFIRGLSALYDRNTTPSDLRTYIQQYLSVQYNAVLDLATESGSNVYGTSFAGPPPNQFTADGQIRSQSILLGAISLRNDTTTNPESETPNYPDPPRSNKNIGAIVGGVVGGIFFIVLVGLAVFFFRRRRHRYRPQVDLNEGESRLPEHATTEYLVAEPFPYSSEMTTANTLGQTVSTPARRYGEKHQLHAASVREREYASGLSQGPPASVSQASGTGDNSRRDMSTAELVELLNERLQPGQWREDERPPEYGVQEGRR